MAIKTVYSSVIATYDKATFNITPSADLETGVDIAPHYIIKNAGKLVSALPTHYSIKEAPTGQSAILDIKYTPPGSAVGGVDTVSIFEDGGPLIVFPVGDLTVLSSSNFRPGLAFELKGRLSCDIVQIGSGVAGKTPTIVVYWKIGS